MKTDDNGYRLIVRALGVSVDSVWESDKGVDKEAQVAQVYEKLGLDPGVKPSMTFMEPYEFLRKYVDREGLDEKQLYELESKVHEPWTLDDLPMMEPWLEQSAPVLDLVGQAVLKPTFCIPLTRSEHPTILANTTLFSDIGRMRSFARMLQTRAQYRIGTSDIDGAMADVISCKRLCRHLEAQQAMVHALVGIAIRGVAAAVGIAAVRESSPSEEQLLRFLDELNAIPVRLDMDQIRLTERYYALDLLQAMAVGDESLSGFFAEWHHLEEFHPGLVAYLAFDWNLVMQRVNEHYDDWGNSLFLHPPRLSPASLMINKRSLGLADLMAGILMPAVQAFDEATFRTRCLDNLQRIALAMLIYERQHGTLPPAYSVDASGQPLHSWRVLLLPYVGQAELFDKLRLDEPWDSDHNRQFHDAAPAIYRCPSTVLLPGQTSYSVIVGKNSAFPAGQGMSLDESEMNRILVVERERPVGWMEPTSELARSTAIQGINRRHAEQDGLGSPHPGGLNVGLRDGSSRFISETIDLQVLQSLVDGTQDRPDY
ncbi:MAG: DUF1559 domain-containing protein [Planctomycetaceae bacterium]|nr:MAG: DUF1559 domain-containing protein [Planctomycetaceae bacterium]